MVAGLRYHREWPNTRLKTTVSRAPSSKALCNDAAVTTPLARPIDSASENPDEDPSERTDRRRLLVVSHPAVMSVNQVVYRELARRGWELTIVVPSRWHHEYSDTDVTPQALPGLEYALRPTPVALRGRPQRHLYLANCRAICARARPHVAFIEAEPFALAAAQWSRALRKQHVPFGVQCYENIDRHLPRPVRWQRSRVLRDAAFVAARSDTAGELARSWGARGEVSLAPPAVPNWESVPAAGERPFTVGYAGRLVEEKGLVDLLAAVRRLEAPLELLLIGDGELRAQLEGQPIPGSAVRVLDDLNHSAMAAGYARLDVLVLPSHTTTTWKEQFGRVIIEALWCGVPVVGSDSGEIPWLIELTGGGLTFPEGDDAALALCLMRLREDAELRRRLAATGRSAVERLFSVSAASDQLEMLLVHAARAGALRAA
jgi:glycosyltransferase involved in cell wall biosynthesis